jgi:Flp pilus assembly protein TadG
MRIKQFLNKAKASMSVFASDTRGQFAIIFGLALLPMALAAGAAVDTLRLTHQQAKMNAALDAASLSAATSLGLSNAKRIEMAENSFFANLSVGLHSTVKGKPEFKITDVSVKGRAFTAVPTTIMRLAGIDEIPVNVTNEIAIAEAKKAEIALVLDSSGSMGDPINGRPKYLVMREQAQKLIVDLTRTEQDRKRIKFGLVPFSSRVMVQLPATMVAGSGSGPFCVSDRAGANSSEAFGEDTTTPWDAEDTWRTPNNGTERCETYARNIVRPLTSDASTIASAVGNIRPMQFTHISLGAEMGYHLLSPTAPFTQGVAWNDDETKKFLVILTDGMQTLPAAGMRGGRGIDEAEENLKKICRQAKRNNVNVITIAFDLDDTATRQNLQDCASDDSFFVADSTESLAGAFDTIKKLLLTQLFLKS